MKRKEADYKRVLLINEHSFNHNNATAITMRSLWEDWPKDRLFEVCFEEYAANTFMLKKSIVLDRGLLGKFRKSKAGSAINYGIKYQSADSKSAIKNLIKTLRECAVEYLCSKKGNMNEGDVSLLDSFEPEIIYTLGGSEGVLKRAFMMSQRYNIPIVIHFMDNWVEYSQHDDNKLLVPFRYSQKKWLMKCMSRCKNAITISESMAEEYKKLFPSVNFTYLMNSVEADEYFCSTKENYNKSTYVFTYAGGLHLERWKALVDVGRAIKDNKINATLNIYTASDINPFQQSFSALPVRFYPPLAHEKVKSIYNDSDCLIHSETSNPILEGYFKYSISTKIPEYLSTGRLMLFYGPSSLGLYRYLKDNNAAALASNYEELKEVVKRIYERNGEFDEIIQNALSLARNNHSKTKSKAELQRIINA